MGTETESDYSEAEGISLAAIERCTSSKLPLILPWHPKQTIPLGTLFYSQRPADPWARNNPFDTYSLVSTPIIINRDDGTDSSFRSESTSRTSDTHDHLSLGFGVGAGLPFLAEVSVKGTYDKDVTENKDANKSSIRSSVRAGSVTFARQPRLSTEAIITVKYDGGLPAFHARYGDYYLAGYKLGGDTGLMISGSNSSKKELERFGITVKVEVLFVEASTTHTKDFVTTQAGGSLKLVGYDTLDHRTWKSSEEGHGNVASKLRYQAAEVITAAQALDMRVAEKLDELGIQDGDHLNAEDCNKLTESGLVVELVLLPVGTLREVIEWVIEDDII
ncbi:hypothetical protein MMC30_006616 [Trapelia coarctata]|nr:hypothetical protein [Trapelia coarctata]